MRKIDKSTFRATEFVKDLKEFETQNEEKHPPYDTGYVFYKKNYAPVFFSLLIQQKGVCAYTEHLLYPNIQEVEEKINQLLLEKEDYPKRKGYLGSIDHYNSNLKKERGWDIQNLFLIHSDLNRDKGIKETLNELNPANPNYSPRYYFYYSLSDHKFYPIRTLEHDLKESVRTQLDDVLGINSPAIVSLRKAYFRGIKTDIKLLGKTIEYFIAVEHNQFFTAFEMCKQDLLDMPLIN